MNIKEFATNLLTKQGIRGYLYEPKLWEAELHNHGYYRIECNWTVAVTVLQWCEANIGEEHFIWFGREIFWFEREQDATLFALRWV